MLMRRIGWWQLSRTYQRCKQGCVGRGPWESGHPPLKHASAEREDGERALSVLIARFLQDVLKARQMLPPTPLFKTVQDHNGMLVEMGILDLPEHTVDKPTATIARPLAACTHSMPQGPRSSFVFGAYFFVISSYTVFIKNIQK